MVVKVGRVLVALVFTLALPLSALSADYASVVVNALKQSSVYVDPQTEGTDTDTAARLSSVLRGGDRIVLVMLPASAASASADGIDAQATRLAELAAQISEGLGNERIIGLAVGRSVVGYAPQLPSGVVSDLMRRAVSVSNDSITALITFAQNVHIWQADNPEPTPIETVTQSGFPFLPLVIVLSIVGGLGLYFLVNRNTAEHLRVRFKVPGDLRETLAVLSRHSQHIQDQELRRAVYKICTDLEIYFRRKRTDHDTVFFKERLDEVTVILEKYLRVQDHPSYHNKPEATLRLGKDSILDFAEYVVQAIKQGNDEDLRDFKLSARALEAYREVRFPDDIDDIMEVRIR